MEEWRDIDGYPNYEVSNAGRIRNKKRGKCLTPQLVKGYPRVVLCRDNMCKPKTVHRLVAEAFCVNKNDGLQINHIDGNKTNNNANNLEWVTGSENIKHAYQNGLKKPPCPKPRKVQIIETNEIFPTASECARQIRGSKRHICECMDGVRQTHKGYHYREILD